MEIQTLHKYRKLVRRGQAPELVCDRCNNAIMTLLDEKKEPVFVCSFCNSITSPPMAQRDRIEAIVKEHFDV